MFTVAITTIKLILIICIFSVSAIGQSFLTDTEEFSGKSLSHRITMDFQEKPIKEILTYLAEESGLSLSYHPHQVSLDDTISIAFENKTIKKALSKLFEGTETTYLLSSSNHLVLRPAEVNQSSQGAQQETVEGEVVDAETGEPLVGVNIMAVDADYGTSTNEEGTFQLQVEDVQTAVLEFSYIGFETKEVELEGRTSLDIELSQDALDEMGEVVVIGYGQERRGRLTGSVSSVDSETIDDATGALSVEQAMQGRVSGVNISSNSGIPGQGLRVDVRGAGSLSAGNEPLYVVDGTPIEGGGSGRFNLGIANESPISHIETSDIKSIDILKDAAATAIYGSRATNGVVLIETKRGESGPTHVNISMDAGIQDIANPVQMADVETWYKVHNEALEHYNQDQGYDETDLGYRHPEEAPDVETQDWLDHVTRDYANTRNYNLSLSGGTDETRVYFSGSHNLEEGIVLSNKFQRSSGRFNIDHQATERLDFSANLDFSRTTNNRIQNEGSGRGILVRSLEQPPFAEPFHEDGSYQVGGVDIPRHNALQVINEQDLEINRYMGMFDVSGALQIASGLQLESKIGGEYGVIHEYTYMNENHPRGGGGGVAYDWREIRRNFLTENTLTFNHTFDNDWNFSALAGHTFQTYEMELNMVNAQDFPSPSFGLITSAGEVIDGHSGWTGYNLNSYLSRVNLNYQDRYSFSTTLRRDGSSKFVGDNRYGTFPSVSAGWRISSEPFFNETGMFDAISNLRFRLSYGKTGNQEGISNFIAVPSATGGQNYRGQSGIAVTEEGNPDLTWETSDQYNVGMELGLFENRINLETNYFYQITDDLLFNRPVHATTGFTTQIDNVGTMSNRGLEIDLNTENIPGRWSTDFNISFTQNEIISLHGDEPIISNRHILKEGYPMGSFFMLKQEGIFQDDDEVPEALYEDGVRAGDIKYDDITGDGNITDEDRQIVGDANPTFYGGLTNTISYRSFDVSMQLDFRYGNKIYNRAAENIDHLGNLDFGLRQEAVDNRWTEPGSSNTVPRASLDDYNLQSSTRFLEDGSFIRLQSVAVRYNLPSQLTERLRIREAQVQLSGSNIFTLTGYSGMDPDVSRSLSPTNMGEDYFNVPNMRSFKMGINVGF